MWTPVAITGLVTAITALLGTAVTLVKLLRHQATPAARAHPPASPRPVPTPRRPSPPGG